MVSLLAALFVLIVDKVWEGYRWEKRKRKRNLPKRKLP